MEEKFIKIRCQDYMDMKPSYEIRVCTLQQAKEYVAYMKENYHSGTTELEGIMNGKEVVKWICSEVKKHNFTSNDADVEWFANVVKKFVDCYVKD